MWIIKANYTYHSDTSACRETPHLRLVWLMLKHVQLNLSNVSSVSCHLDEHCFRTGQPSLAALGKAESKLCGKTMLNKILVIATYLQHVWTGAVMSMAMPVLLKSRLHTALSVLGPMAWARNLMVGTEVRVQKAAVWHWPGADKCYPPCLSQEKQQGPVWSTAARCWDLSHCCQVQDVDHNFHKFLPVSCYKLNP